MKNGFVIHHNGPPANCVGRTHDRCIKFWNAVKSYHTGKGWSDIAYSFGVCPHGIRFTGRGWYKNQFANGTDVVPPYDGKDSEWYTVLVFIGQDEVPPPEMIEATAALITEGRDSAFCGMRVLPHNAFKKKACPGPEFSALAQLWNGRSISAKQDPQPPETEVTDVENMIVYVDDSDRWWVYNAAVGRSYHCSAATAANWESAGAKRVHIVDTAFANSAAVR